ncbi:CaiB/BaiF CoA transferase family protein [Paracoccus sp. P2]|uniref:CaiB/BaiF CoA transferase family protein n=1 Tax=Paracoccus TaxID=265 RepID=UPI00046752B8|nr:CaiB/BaiF CoA-transferase family protein [Paracoccus pantotrophus]MDF3856282.1 CaiB/BaiF CoA-transferase family protein [Paracoccus pantotrophus]SFP06192.1 Crotonobetainyl-CoA:carnitine CoA-transferase CaiB [Paracoccus pantotrophus]
MTATPLQPYAGLLVVSLEQAVAAPLASCHFARGGARVIKIERETGDFARQYDSAVKGTASYFAWANHGKESLCLDIKDTRDAALLHDILDRADVFIQNLAPGAVARAGFGTEALRRRNPRLITCDISGYGEDGAYRDMKAYDFLVQCESGLVAVNGAPGHPGRIGVSVCDIGAGMNAVIGIQKALYARSITGEGSAVKLSLFDTAADWMTVPLMHAVYAGKAPQPAGLHHPSIAPYGGFRTADGEVLAISVQNEREWASLCEGVFGRPELARDPRFCDAARRVANRAALDAIVAGFFAARSRAELESLLREAAIAYGAVNSVERFAQHPQLRRAPVTLEDGAEAHLVAPPVRHSFEPETPHLGRVPGLGEHSAAIRAEFARIGETA